LKGPDDERVAAEYRQRFSVGGVHRRLAATFGGVVEAREVVVYEGCTVQKLDGAGGGACALLRASTCEVYGVAKPRPQACAATEAGVSHRISKAWRYAAPSGDGFQVVSQSRFQNQM
jgi:hypothetical protein